MRDVYQDEEEDEEVFLDYSPSQFVRELREGGEVREFYKEGFGVIPDVYQVIMESLEDERE
jgi:hypothetical protein